MSNMMLHQAAILVASLFVVGLASVLGAQHGCPPSSCGHLQDIRYPFRLKGDPAACGDRRYELTCEDNKPILKFHSAKYYVKSISYTSGEEIIQITDIRFADGGCPLPSQTLSPQAVSYVEGRSFNYPVFWASFIKAVSYVEGRSFNYPVFWASFINCTKELQGDEYMHIPCLSGMNASVYVVFNSTLAALAPSCKFRAMVPTVYHNVIGLRKHPYYGGTGAHVLELLQYGIYLSWINPKCGPMSSVIKDCLAKATDFHIYLGMDPTSYFYMISTPPLNLWYIFNCLDPPSNCRSNYAVFMLIRFVIVLIGALYILVAARLLVMLLLKVITISAFLAYKFRQRRIPLDAVEKFLLNQQSLSPARFAYMDIIVMTRNFKDKLGQGGFGSVYKGELPGGFQVAVKMLGNSKCNGDDFISEVSTIGMIHHVNIVRLVGFCSDGSKRALVYEYLAKGSLDKYIFSAKAATQRPFTWEKLIDIALRVARGIDYLHGGCDKQILHFDIKPHNILLDNSFNPKVSDFGLAKLFPKDHSMVALSAARGTIGYIAPELISRSFGIISHKSDVYSFGMLLLEMAGGRRNVEQKAENTSQIYYPSWIYDELNDQKGLEGRVDSIVEDVMTIGEVEKKLSIVGLWCIQTTPSVRPSMSRVIEMLQAEVDTLQMPPKPFSAETFSSVPIMDGSMESSSTTLTDISEEASLLCLEDQHHSSCQSGHDEL